VEAQAEHEIETDLLVIGAGPAGLFATYYAGFRGLRVVLADSLPELGGQVTAMYPEKEIHDVAGFVHVKGRDLVEALAEQAATAHAHQLLGRTASTLEHHEDHVLVGFDDGCRVRTGAVVITGGIGRFSPRPLPAAAGWEGRGVEFFVPSRAPYAGKDVVVVGGGDSALDWALHLHPVAASVTLVHRRDVFRAHERSVTAAREAGVRIVTRAEVSELRGDPDLAEVLLKVEEAPDPLVLPCQAVVAALGFVADLGPIQHWGIETERRHVVVDTAMRTNLPRVFAAGDVATYPGKVNLIAVGFGEAAIAVNHAAATVDPSSKVFPGHSSDA